MEWTEKELEKFIKENKDKFDIYHPEPNHEQHFLIKLINKFKELISIVPYLIKVLIITVVVFVVSIWIWDNYIRKDRNDITLRQKIENILTHKK
jgi:hypothetical protein